MVEPIVGVIGGMGPEATVELMRRVIDATPALDDADHIHMIVDNNPKVPSRIKALIDGDGESPGPAMAAMARRLEIAGADFLVIPCNTAHHYWSHASEAVAIPVWHLPELTLSRIATTIGSAEAIGMLASPALRQVELYEPHCRRLGMRPLYPKREEDLLQVIKAVKAKRVGDREIELFRRAAGELAAAGAHAIVLACTEFSLVSDRLELQVPTFDTLQVLAEQIVAEVKG